MIVELDTEDFSGVLPLYRASGYCFPLMSAVIQRQQRGQIFADQKRNPRASVVVNNFGFMCLLGAGDDPEFNRSLIETFESGDRIRPSYLLWYAPPHNWQDKLHAAGARRRERIRFEFRRLSNEPVNVPAGFEMRKLDRQLLPKTSKFKLDLDSRFWASAEDFEKNGLGICILKDNDVVSVCYAAAISDGLAEVDVVTDEAYRGHGLATLASRQFIRECLTRGITPTWDCFDYNTNSYRLAERLGFSELVRYPFYSFNIPLTLDHGA
jgi:RimJ/RimL family protein N-acetyltransferase